MSGTIDAIKSFFSGKAINLGQTKKGYANLDKKAGKLEVSTGKPIPIHDISTLVERMEKKFGIKADNYIAGFSPSGEIESLTINFPSEKEPAASDTATANPSTEVY